MRTEVIAAGLGVLVGISVGAFLNSTLTEDATIEDIDQHVRVIYDVTNGVRVQADPGIVPRKIPCYDGDPTRQCIWISCPACPECDAATDADDDGMASESTDEPAG